MSVYVCACWVGCWLPGCKARQWWYMCAVEGHSSLSLRKTKKVLFTTFCKECKTVEDKYRDCQTNKKLNMSGLSSPG